MFNKYFKYFMIALLAGLIGVTINTYFKANSFKNFAVNFPVDILPKEEGSKLKYFSITEANIKQTPIGLREKMNIIFSDNYLSFTPYGLYSLFYPEFQLNKEDIHSCSKQCGGSTRYIVILESIRSELSMEKVPDLIEWCWNNRLPILSSERRRQWLYDNGTLPNKRIEIEKLTTYEDYLFQAKQSCLGY